MSIAYFSGSSISDEREKGMGRRAQRNDPDGLRNAIIDQAFEAFTVHGFGSTSIGDLKAAMGVSGGAFSHHFPTKKALGLAVIRERVAASIEATWIDPLRRAPSAISGLDAVFLSVIDELDANGKVSGCPLGNLAVELSRQDDDLRLEMDAIYARWRAVIAERLPHRASEDPAGPGDADGLATLVVATFTGGITMAKASQTSEPLRRSWQRLRSLLAAS
ncbi:TetR/AcrR family transcriptional regulator [Bosea lupini]|nr:TetR/AcrR family transcriptional regulator [Bosea lupini]